MEFKLKMYCEMYIHHLIDVFTGIHHGYVTLWDF